MKKLNDIDSKYWIYPKDVKKENNSIETNRK